MGTMLLMVIIGIGLSVSNANGWFIVPDFCLWICFGLAAIFFVVWLVNLITAKKTLRKINRKF